MSTALPQAKDAIVQPATITVVAATYNEKFVAPLLNNCLDELALALPQASINLVRVPGSYEVPVMVKRSIALADKKPDVVIALGLIIRGSTAHADLIGQAITQQLMSIACDSLVPVIHEVLLLDTEQQAHDRCIGDALNRGREAARAAAAMVQTMAEQNSNF